MEHIACAIWLVGFLFIMEYSSDREKLRVLKGEAKRPFKPSDAFAEFFVWVIVAIILY